MNVGAIYTRTNLFYARMRVGNCTVMQTVILGLVSGTVGNWCSVQCGFGCNGWRVVDGACELANDSHVVGPGWNGRPEAPSGCYPHNSECIACPGTPRPANFRPHYTIRASGNCRSHTPGVVEWTDAVQLTGGTLAGTPGVEANVVRGKCPLVVANDNARIRDVAFECTSGDYAIQLMGKGVKITNVRSNVAVLRGVNVKGLDVRHLHLVNVRVVDVTVTHCDGCVGYWVAGGVVF